MSLLRLHQPLLELIFGHGNRVSANALRLASMAMYEAVEEASRIARRVLEETPVTIGGYVVPTGKSTIRELIIATEMANVWGIGPSGVSAMGLSLADIAYDSASHGDYSQMCEILVRSQCRLSIVRAVVEAVLRDSLADAIPYLRTHILAICAADRNWLVTKTVRASRQTLDAVLEIIGNLHIQLDQPELVTLHTKWCEICRNIVLSNDTSRFAMVVPGSSTPVHHYSIVGLLPLCSEETIAYILQIPNILRHTEYVDMWVAIGDVGKLSELIRKYPMESYRKYREFFSTLKLAGIAEEDVLTPEQISDCNHIDKNITDPDLRWFCNFRSWLGDYSVFNRPDLWLDSYCVRPHRPALYPLVPGWTVV
jgi:hypothetical protein